MSETKFSRSRRYFFILGALVIFLSLIILLNSRYRYFHADELEHVHAAWYVAQGQIPYLDFFENHNPLLWYLLAPLILVLGDTTMILLLARLLMFAFILGIGFLTWRLAEKVSRSKETAGIAVPLLLSLLLFVEPAIEIRPDVPQVFFGLVSLYLLFSYFDEPRDREMVFSGLSAAAAFLFTQKTVFLLFGMGLVLIYRLWRGQVKLRPIFFFAAGFSLPVVLFLGGLALSGALPDYLILGWLFNMKFITSYPLWEILGPFLLPNVLFWLILPVSLAFIVLKKGVAPGMKIVALLGAGLFLVVFRVKHPFAQYFLPSLPLLAIASGYFLREGFVRFNLGDLGRVIILILLLAEPAVFLAKKSQEGNTSQISQIDYVLRNTDRTDYVYDGNLAFNLFRRDLHYFWFHNRPWGGLDQYRRLAWNKYFGRYIKPENCKYDMCEMIKSKKPKFILGFTYVQEKCGLRDLYEDTSFEKVKVRKERGGPDR